MNDIIEKMRNGKRPLETDSDFPLLCKEIENTKRLVVELNTGYHTPDEVRALLERIWGQSLDASVRMFPPFYTAFGKTTRVGKDVFINFGCTFLDQGGITLEDGVFIGPGAKILTEAHPDPKSDTRCRQNRSLSAVWHGLVQELLSCRVLRSARMPSLPPELS